MNYILAIDQGTTGSSALLVDQNLKVIAEASQDFVQHYPEPGRVEHDLKQVWDSVLSVIKKVTLGIDCHQIIGIGLTNQRETLCLWDRNTTEPLAPAIVWQDRRSTQICEQLKKLGLEDSFREMTGLLLDPYFTGTKLSWALKNWPSVKDAERKGHLCAGTMDSYLIAKMSGGQAHVTEPSNACRTLAYHLTDHEFSDELSLMLEVPVALWPKVLPSVGHFAVTQGVPGLPDGIPITGVLGDQQSALLGQACVDPGAVKCTYGTGAFLLMNTGNQPIRSKHRLVTSIGWALNSEDFTYILEGSAFIAGAAVQWLRDGLGLIQNASEIETLARKVKSSDGVVFVPALTGLGAPHWDPRATGLLTGISRGTTSGHIARAVLEGIAFQNADILSAMERDLGRKLESLNVDGGASANTLLIQFQADILNLTLKRPKYQETTLLGAVFAAGLGAKVWTSLEEIKKTWQEDRQFLPEMSQVDRVSHLDRWRIATSRAMLHQPA